MIIYRCTTVLINTVQKKLPAQVMLFCPLEVKILYVATHIILVRSGKSLPFCGNSGSISCHMLSIALQLMHPAYHSSTTLMAYTMILTAAKQV